jgi:5-carboxymethyl-2-hydroxymuconate isomerase
MIVVSAAYTDNLGPEADIADLLAKAAAKLAETCPDELVLTGARSLTGFTLDPTGFTAILLRVEAPAALIASLRSEVLAALADLADAHLAGLYPRRAIAVSAALHTLGQEALIERRREAPSAETF